MVEINDQNVLFRMVRVHLVPTYDHHQEIQRVEDLLHVHIVADLVDPDYHNWAVVLAVPVSVYKALIEVLNGVGLKLGY